MTWAMQMAVAVVVMTTAMARAWEFAMTNMMATVSAMTMATAPEKSVILTNNISKIFT